MDNNHSPQEMNPTESTAVATGNNVAQTLQTLQNTSLRLERNLDLQQSILATLPLLRLAGYGLLVIECVDFVSLALGAKLMDAKWEWNAFGFAALQMPIIILTCVCILFGAAYSRSRPEQVLLKFLRWGLLCLGLVYLLMIPWSANNLNRLYTTLETDYSRQLSEIKRGADQAREQVNFFEKNPQALEKIEGAAKSAPADTLAQMKEKVSGVNYALTSQAAQEYQQKRNALRKQSVIWYGYTMVGIVVLFVLFQKSRWIKEIRTATSAVEGAGKHRLRFLWRIMTAPFIRFHIACLKLFDMLSKIPWIIQMEWRMFRKRFFRR